MFLYRREDVVPVLRRIQSEPGFKELGSTARIERLQSKGLIFVVCWVCAGTGCNNCGCEGVIAAFDRPD